jgi:hypothetical protein
MKRLLLLTLPFVAPAPVADQGPVEFATSLVQALEAKDPAAWNALLAADLAPSDAVQVKKLYTLGTERECELTPGEPFPENRNRAVVPLGIRVQVEGQTLAGIRHLFLTRAEEEWKLTGLDPDASSAREWLYELGKPGAEPTAELTLGSFVIALRRGDVAAAERACTNLCWDGPGGETARYMYESARESTLSFSMHSLEQEGDHAVAHMLVRVGEQEEPNMDFYLVNREGGWLIGGFGGAPEHAKRFLAGEVGARPWPVTAAEAADYLLLAMSERRPLRVRTICAPEALGAGKEISLLYDGLGGKFRSVRRTDGAQMVDGRAAVRLAIEDAEGEPAPALWLTLSSTPDGWKVTGATGDAELAAAYPTAR